MNLNSLYKTYVQNGLDNNFWGQLPKKIDEISEFIKPKKKGLIDKKQLESIKKIIEKTHKQFGVYSSSVQKLLEDWDDNSHVIEIGHQPLYFGGSSFIFNKLSYTIALAQYLTNEEHLHAVPLFFLGDHDQVQNELIITRFPQTQSSHGLELKSDEFDKNISTPVAYLEKPSESSLLDNFEKIRTNFRELFRLAKIKGHYRPLLEERLETSLTLLYDSYLESQYFGDWIGRFWSKFFILQNKTPLLIIKASDPDLRQLLVPYYENLLEEDTRLSLIHTLNEKHEEIEQLGYKPGLSLRDESEAPFFYECPKCSNRNRIKLEVIDSTLQGKCESCKHEINIKYDPKSPDLKEHFANLSPRVETRSIILNQLIKPSIRITGGGETTYHAQIIPFLKQEELHFPLILKHPRIYYNTPWSEKIASSINFDGLSTIHNSDTFSRMAQISKEQNYDELLQLLQENEQALNTTLLTFNEAEENYENNPTKQNLRKLNFVQLYLSHSFGKYQKNKSIQEVSWNWMDLGLLTGLNDFVGFYIRRIKPNLPISPTFWLSAGQFN